MARGFIAGGYQRGITNILAGGFSLMELVINPLCFYYAS